MTNQHPIHRMTNCYPIRQSSDQPAIRRQANQYQSQSDITEAPKRWIAGLRISLAKSSLARLVAGFSR
jgi:hypothetical protein